MRHDRLMISTRRARAELTPLKKAFILQSRGVMIFARTAFQLTVFTIIMVLFSSAMSSDPVSTTVTEIDNDREIIVPLDSVLEVKLQTTLSTGYDWEILEFNTLLLEFLEDSVVKAPGEKLVGTKEYHLFRFRTKAKGHTALKMKYHRQWEKGVPPLKTYEIKLQIN